MKPYQVSRGPEGFLPPAAAMMGVTLPVEGQGSILGLRVFEDQAIEEAARQLAHAKVPTIFPGPLVLWGWNAQAIEMANAVAHVAETCGINIIPMPDYRPKYPKIDPEAEINPNHPNLTIWHNKIDVCLFVGVHCHYSNLALKIIRGGTSCYTIALCNFAGDEEANLTIRDLTSEKILKIGETIQKMKRDSRRF
jgi:aldehyde:ferredoxin oxidoreductase